MQDTTQKKTQKNIQKKEIKSQKQNQKKPAGGRRRTHTKKRRQQIIRRFLLFLFCAAAISIAAGRYRAGRSRQDTHSAQILQEYEGRIPRPELDVQLLTVNEYSRPALILDKVKGVVIHYTANPGTSAAANRSYFEGLKDSHITKASSHFIVGLEGEIVQCIPCSEMSYASNERNQDTISIECCIEDDTGKFNSMTYDSVCHLTAWLVERYQLDVSDVIRHYDVTGKACPKYFVDHPDAWEQFHADVQAYLDRYGV